MEASPTPSRHSLSATSCNVWSLVPVKTWHNILWDYIQCFNSHWQQLLHAQSWGDLRISQLLQQSRLTLSCFLLTSKTATISSFMPQAYITYRHMVFNSSFASCRAQQWSGILHIPYECLSYLFVQEEGQSHFPVSVRKNTRLTWDSFTKKGCVKTDRWVKK